MRKNKFTKIGIADFETIVNPDETRIWAWDICNLDKFEHEQGTDMNSFMIAIQKYKSIYFHNAKFDTSFIIDWLLRNGWSYNHANIKDDIEANENYTFEVLRSSKNVFYGMTLYFKPEISHYETYYNKYAKKCKKKVVESQGLKIDIYDSLKLLPFSVSELAKAWELPISKLSIDYEAYRPIGHKLTKEESNYIKNDTEIVAHVIKEFIERGFTSMTIGGNALRNFKKRYDKEDLEKALPELPDFIDEWLRPAYKGGFVWVNPKIQNKEVGIGCVYDNNSMHPHQLRHMPMPYGMPIYFEGEPDYNKYPLFVVKILISGKCKEEHIPCISTRNSFGYVDSEYLYEVNGLELTVTNIDLELIKEQYDCNITYIEGMYFNACNNLFNDYIDEWMEEKIKAVSKAKRNIAKLFLNNLYGKFGTRKDNEVMIPILDKQKDCVRWQVAYSLNEPNAEYLPIAIFTTSYSRDLIIRSGQAVFDRLCYCDTDSLHLTGWEVPTNIEIDDSKLGKWKLESNFIRAKFLRCKRYIEEELTKTSFIMDGIYGSTHMNIKCGGMPENIKKQVTWDNFKVGTEFQGKLMPKVIKGGMVLMPTTYKMK